MFFIVPGGKIHDGACGAIQPTTRRSKNEEINRMTRDELVAKYGSACCGNCFPTAPKGAAPKPAKPVSQPVDKKARRAEYLRSEIAFLATVHNNEKAAAEMAALEAELAAL